jgi:proteasome accessory factor C
MPKVEHSGEDLFNLAIAVVGLVLKSQPLSKQQLAAHFKVSERAIERAVMAVSLAEDNRRFYSFFELDWDAWAQGEVSISAQGELSAPPPLSRHQVAALAMALEYLSSLPEYAQNPELERLREVFQSVPVAQLPSVGNANGNLEVLRSALGQRRVRVRYLNQRGEQAIREIDPLRIDFLADRYYLRGWCHTNFEVRNFRIDRMADIELLETAIAPEAITAKFDEDLFAASGDSYEVTLETNDWALEIFWNFPVSDPPSRNETGHWRGSIKIGNVAALGRHVARYGGAVRVLGPIQAQQAVIDFVTRALAKESHE